MLQELRGCISILAAYGLLGSLSFAAWWVVSTINSHLGNAVCCTIVVLSIVFPLLLVLLLIAMMVLSALQQSQNYNLLIWLFWGLTVAIGVTAFMTIIRLPDSDLIRGMAGFGACQVVAISPWLVAVILSPKKLSMNPRHNGRAGEVHMPRR